MKQAPQDLFKAAYAVLNHSYSPYSHYQVACALRASDGSIYAGCNVENGSYSCTLCAESSALGAMVSAGQRKIQEVLILVSDDKIATPCGPCRQRLHEFSSAETVVHCATVDHVYERYRLADLLPFAFDFAADEN